jgi:hypothetical protein
MGGSRERWIADQISQANLLVPTAVSIAQHGGGIAVAFTIDTVTETIEGCGDSDQAAAADVVRQLRVRLAQS